MIKKILFAPHLCNISETSRMVLVAKECYALGNEIFFLGKGDYDYLFKEIPSFKQEYIKADTLGMNNDSYRLIFSKGPDFLELKDLDHYIFQEIALLNKIKPDIIVTGLRPTLSISSRIAQIPLVWILSTTVSDLFFSFGLASTSFKARNEFPILKYMPQFISDRLFSYFWFHNAHTIKNYNSILIKYGFKPLSCETLIYRGDLNLMSDAPELFPEIDTLPPYYKFCGPISPSVTFKLPQSLKTFIKNKYRPVIFLSMGTSGNPHIFCNILDILKDKPYDIFASTTSIVDNVALKNLPKNVFIEPFYPLHEMMSISDVAVIHGGQGTLYAAISSSTPFIGIPTIPEQQYNLQNMAKKGAGIVLDKLNPDILNASIERIIADSSFKNNVKYYSTMIAKYLDEKNDKYSPRIAALQIIQFLENPVNSYFQLKNM